MMDGAEVRGAYRRINGSLTGKPLITGPSRRATPKQNNQPKGSKSYCERLAVHGLITGNF